MIDGSHHPFEENIRLTRQVVDYAHERDVTVEGELGVLAGVEDEVSAAASHYTKPSEVEEFVQRPGWIPWPSPSAPPMGPSSSR